MGTLALAAGPARAGGGYFLLGYGPFAQQMAGTSTAVGFDSFAAASNPGKLFEAGNRLDAGLQIFLPYRHIARTDAATPTADIASTSRHGFFLLPDGGIAHRIHEHLAWGFTIYGNGGLDTDYRNTNNLPGTNLNPAACGTQPANFLFGCGRLGFNLSQIMLAPSLAWQFAQGQSVGIAPLIAYQRIDIYGFQALEGFSERPDAVTNNGYDHAFGTGVRVGWFGRLTPWLDAGVAYSSEIFMQRFKRYQGLIADSGRFDIPANYSVGVAIHPTSSFTVAVDVQRVEWHSIAALGNGVLSSLRDPAGAPFGSHDGSGFNWRNENTYRLGLTYKVSERLTARVGYAYGRRPADGSINSATFGMFAPNPIHQIAAGGTARINAHNEMQLAYQRYVPGTYSGPSATTGLGLGGTETIHPNVTVIYLAWTWRM